MASVKHKVLTDESGQRYVPDHFIYKAVVTSLAASASLTAQIAIEANSDFVWLKTAYVADIAGAAQTDSTRVIPLVRVAITDSGSGANLQNLPIPIGAMGGNGGLPLAMSQPRVFSANSNISITFTNYSAATTYANVELMFIGYRKFFQ